MYTSAVRLLGVALILIGVNAQTYTACDPTNVTCPPTPGLDSTYYFIDFTTINSTPKDWIVPTWCRVTYNTKGRQNGAELEFLERYDSQQLYSSFYFLFGRIEFVVQAAPGPGIISDMMTLSDDLDELDWEFRGTLDDEVQTGWFGKGVTGLYNHSITPKIPTPMTQFHTYAFDWTADRVIWEADGTVVRTLYAADCVGTANQYPQTPMKAMIGLWDAGDPDHYDPWSAGLTPIPPPAGGYSFYVKSVKIWNKNPAACYDWVGHSGSWQSIKAINDSSACGISPRSSSTIVPLSATSSSLSTIRFPSSATSSLSSIITSLSTATSSSSTTIVSLPSTTSSLSSMIMPLSPTTSSPSSMIVPLSTATSSSSTMIVSLSPATSSLSSMISSLSPKTSSSSSTMIPISSTTPSSSSKITPLSQAFSSSSTIASSTLATSSPSSTIATSQLTMSSSHLFSASSSMSLQISSSLSSSSLTLATSLSAISSSHQLLANSSTPFQHSPSASLIKLASPTQSVNSIKQSSVASSSRASLGTQSSKTLASGIPLSDIGSSGAQIPSISSSAIHPSFSQPSSTYPPSHLSTNTQLPSIPPLSVLSPTSVTGSTQMSATKSSSPLNSSTMSNTVLPIQASAYQSPNPSKPSPAPQTSYIPHTPSGIANPSSSSKTGSLETSKATTSAPGSAALSPSSIHTGTPSSPIPSTSNIPPHIPSPTISTTPPSTILPTTNPSSPPQPTPTPHWNTITIILNLPGYQTLSYNPAVEVEEFEILITSLEELIQRHHHFPKRDLHEVPSELSSAPLSQSSSLDPAVAPRAHHHGHQHDHLHEQLHRRGADLLQARAAASSSGAVGNLAASTTQIQSAASSPFPHAESQIPYSFVADMSTVPGNLLPAQEQASPEGVKDTKMDPQRQDSAAVRVSVWSLEALLLTYLLLWMGIW